MQEIVYVVLLLLFTYGNLQCYMYMTSTLMNNHFYRTPQTYHVRIYMYMYMNTQAHDSLYTIVSVEIHLHVYTHVLYVQYIFIAVGKFVAVL